MRTFRMKRTLLRRCGAGGRIRTPDLLITNQLLYRLSYTSKWRLSTNSERYYSKERKVCQVKKQIFFAPPLRDLQARRPARLCPRCGGEQYPYDRDGWLCTRCLNRYTLRREHHDVS